MKVSAHNGVSPAWPSPYRATRHTSTAQKITINPEVENYRVVSGSGSHEIEFLEHVLDYSTSMPLRQRGISKVVFDKGHYLQARSYLSQEQPLNERLSREGVEIVMMEDIAAFVEKRYPKVSATLKLLEKLCDFDEEGRYQDSSEKEVFELYVDVILFFLPEYVFSSGNNKHLKLVTITRNNFFSSLFLPADVDSHIPPAGALIEVVEKRETDFYPSFIIDGSVLSSVTMRDGQSISQFFALENNNGFRVIINPHHHLWVKSHHLAEELARVTNQVITRYLDQPLLVRTTYSKLIEQNENQSFFMESRKTLAQIINDQNAKGTAICHVLTPIRPKRKIEFRCRAVGVFDFYLDLRSDLVCMLNKECLLPGFKQFAQNCGVQYIEDPSPKDAEVINQLVKASNILWLFQTQSTFFSDNTAKMTCFTTRIFPDTSESIRAKYLLEASYRGREDLLPPCLPMIKRSDVRRLASSTDFMGELKKINEEVLGLYSLQTGRFCGNYKPLQSHNPLVPSTTPHYNGYGIFSIVAGCAVAPVRALAPGLFLGMITGFTGHIHRDVVTQRPVACALACAASSAMGYCTMGLLGVGLNLGFWACQSPLSRELAAKFKSVRCSRVSEVVQGLLVLPMLAGGTYQFAVGVAGVVLGNYCTSAVAGKVLKTRGDRGEKQQRGVPTERRKKRRRSPALAAPEAVRHREKDALGTNTFADTSHQDDAAVFRRRTIHSMLASPDELPWLMPDIELLVMAYARNIEDRQERADYLEQRLTECEKATDGLLFAVSRFTDLYGQYLQAHQGNDIRRAKALWAILTPASSQELLVLAGKMLVQDCLNNDYPTEAQATLDDPRLTGDAALGIINDLSGAEVLFRDGAPEKLTRAYLARVNLKERKQKTPNHVRDAVTRWLGQRAKKPELTDNLLHLAMDFRPADGHDEQTTILIRDFRDALRNQAEVEARYLPDTKNKVQRYLRAGAVKIALNESHQ